MIRLSEARARCELRNEILESDALEVVEIMKFSLWETYQHESVTRQGGNSHGGVRGTQGNDLFCVCILYWQMTDEEQKADLSQANTLSLRGTFHLCSFTVCKLLIPIE